MIHDLSFIIMDFDGVFTDNFVYTDSLGNESVKTSRSDSLGLDKFRKFQSEIGSRCELLIVSTEENSVVVQRANKLKIKSHTGISNKREFITNQIFSGDVALWNRAAYLGNDLNDLEAIKASRISFAPADAHKDILKFVTFVMTRNGGDGFVRETLEYLTNQTKQKDM